MMILSSLSAAGDRFAYWVKMRMPWVFRRLSNFAGWLAGMRYRKRLQRAREHARIRGSIDSADAHIRALDGTDVEQLVAFFASIPERRLEYFRPHALDQDSVARILKAPCYSCYGIFKQDVLVAYCLLKVSPSGAGYVGLLVDESMDGRGLGRFIVHFLYWQATLAGLTTRSTISRDNVASIRCHEAVAQFRVIASFDNNYQMIEFPAQHVEPPALCA